MKLRFLFVSAILVAFALIFSIISCSEEAPWVTPPAQPTELFSLRIQPVDFDSSNIPINRPNTAIDVIVPEPVEKEDWDDISFNLFETDYTQMWVLREEYSETARIIAEISPNCIVQWGIGSSGVRPIYFGNPSEPLSFGDDDYLYIKVSSRNGLYYNHYRVHARLASPVNLISVMTISGRQSDVSYSAGRQNWEDARDNAPLLPLSIAKKEGLGAELLVRKMDENATVKYAVVNVTEGQGVENLTLNQLNFQYDESDQIEVWNPETSANEIQMGARVPIADQNILIAAVTAQNTLDTNYYKFRVSVGRIADIARLDMDTTQILSLGVPDPEWGNVIAGSFGTADQPLVSGTQNYLGFSINITLADEDASYEIVKTDPAPPAPEPAPLPDAFNDNKTAKMAFENREELAIKVTSYTQTDIMYYRVRVDLLAANITVQPISAVYNITSYNYPLTPIDYSFTNDGNTFNFHYERIMIDAVGTRTLDKPIAPLEAKVDRTIAGATYQWYTANSWYGGYGFDKEGRIRGDPGFIQDSFHPSTDRGGLDEKNNVSLHNGGNQFYRLPVGYPLDNPLYPGEEIVGATSAQYTPVIDASKRPFLAASTNQSQFYWVVITGADGKKVVSERAVIIAEWGEIFDMGHPTGDKINKKHHIVDLNNDLVGKDGRKYTKKNVMPFTFHRDEYIFPVKFPEDFNIMDYSFATAQAVFFLKDGRTWIQNWTQGDINFYVSEDDNIVSSEKEVGFYNLTNNNATLGLRGGSNAPSGASLNLTPTHIGIATAGETDPNNLPLFEPDGVTPSDMWNAQKVSAQGWFCAYIELVELRFEGPPR